MFTITDFINLMNYFKGEDVPEMDMKLQALASDSKAKATTLFNESIDQLCHSTDDYKRLKNFLISWYASLKTFPTTMKSVSDIRVLPDTHLNELFKSFGFIDALTEIPKANKVDFFYDLVNLYKIKGTPESIERALTYFGIPDVDIMEFWLQYDENGTLVFRPSLLTNYGKNDTVKDLDFNYTTSVDPHWMLDESRINQLFLQNKIAFPSKTPYFGIRPTVQLVGNIINPVMCILTRIVLDQYESFISGNPPVKDTRLPTINIYVSGLDLYLATIYAFNKAYPKTFDPSSLYTYVYNGSFTDPLTGNPIPYDDIIAEFEDILKRSNTKTRSDINSTRILFNDTFTKLRSENFLIDLNTAGTILATTNPDLKAVIDENFSANNKDYILQYLIKNLVNWMTVNITPAAPNLSVSIFGFLTLTYVLQVINFFKPYRSRLILFEDAFTIQLPALDTVIIEDYFSPIGETDTFIDFDTGDSSPSYSEDESSINKVYYSRDILDCGSYLDIGAFTDDPPPSDSTTVQFFSYIDDNITEKYNNHQGDSTSSLTYTVDSTGAVDTVIVLGGWEGYDESLIYDMPPIPDRCEIFVHGPIIPVVTSLYSDVIIDFHDGINIDGLSVNHLVAE